MQSSITVTEAKNQRKSFIRKVLYVAMPTIGVGVYFITSVLFEGYAISQLLK